MRVVNVHRRDLPGPPAAAAPLLDRVAEPDGRLWPRDRWPRMKLDRGLEPGSHGGHGPIRYAVERYEPGREVRFRFLAPRGFDGGHRFTLEPAGAGCRLTHTVEVKLRGPALLAWPLLWCPLHDALVEDALDRAAIELGGEPAAPRWGWRVRLLRRLARRRR